MAGPFTGLALGRVEAQRQQCISWKGGRASETVRKWETVQVELRASVWSFENGLRMRLELGKAPSFLFPAALMLTGCPNHPNNLIGPLLQRRGSSSVPHQRAFPVFAQ